MMFTCKVCVEKNARIADLKNEIAFLRSQVGADFSAPRYMETGFEADGILSAQQHVVEIPTSPVRAEGAEAEAEDEIRRERDRILSGTY